MDTLFCKPSDIEAEMAEWEAAQEQALAHEASAGAHGELTKPFENSGNSLSGNIAMDSACASEQPVSLTLPFITPEKKPQPANQAGHGNGGSNTPIKRKMDEAVGTPLGKPAKRVTCKTKAADVPHEVRSAVPAGTQAMMDPTALMQLMKDKTPYVCFRDFYIKTSRNIHKKNLPDAKSCDILAAQRNAWANMPRNEKLQFIQDTLHLEYSCCPKVKAGKVVEHYSVDYVRQHEVKMQEACQNDPKAPGKHRGCLYTWNGMMMEGSNEIEALVEQYDDMSELEAALKLSGTFRQLVVDYQVFVEKRMGQLSFKHFSWVVEMSLHSRDRGRIHFHLYLSDDTDRRFIGTQSAWKFRGFRPDLRPAWHTGRNSAAAINHGHYYCQCNKEGTLYQQTNYMKHQNFAVEQKWIIAFWKVRKLSTERAVLEVKQARGSTISYLRELAKIDEIDEEDFVRVEQKQILDLIEANRVPFRLILDVALWQRQYLEWTDGGVWGKDSRFKFLVLTGPSSFGKTQYAKSLWGSDYTLVVNCQNVMEPNLKAYSRRKHKAVIFDECACSTILFSKVTFQASVEGTMLAQSQCNEHAYWRFLYGIPLIVCCNDWLRGVKDPADFEWLTTNAITYNVSRPTWTTMEEEMVGIIED